MFFDETFRTSLRQPNISFGALCGIGIPERSLGRIAADVYQLKLKHLGADFARDEEIKGKELLAIRARKEKAPSDLSARGRDKKAQHSALKLQSGWANHIELSRSTRLERTSAW